VNTCYLRGWVVGKGALPSDPVEHDVSGLPIHGCNHLACSVCKRVVRTGICAKGVVGVAAVARDVYEAIPSWSADPGAVVRVYACACHLHREVLPASIHHDYAYDEELIPWKSDWSCAGHPLAELPRAFDGVAVTAENLEALVDAAMAGVLPAELQGPVDRDPRLWVARLATRLDGTPQQARVVDAVARHLTSADVAARVRAVCFFADTERFVASMRLPALLGEHAALFVGVPNPHSKLATTKTLDRLLWSTCRRELRVSAELREVARVSALDAARSSKALFFALAHDDAAWLAENAVLVARAHDGEPRRELLAVLRATGLGAARDAIEKDALPKPSLVAVLAEARARLADPRNDFTWSSWEGTEDALAELDRHIASVEKGEIPLRSLSVIFAPTGPMQEVAVQSGWGGELLAIVDRFDEAVESIRGQGR